MATRNQLNPPPLRRITDFKSKLTGGGARSNLFEVVLSFPEVAPADTVVLDKSRFLCKTAALPASTVASLPIAFRGRTLNVAGDRTFESWSVNIINDTDFAIRSAFENWMNTINRVSDNTGVTDPALYQADAFVHQLDRDGSTLRAYHFYDIFPTNITAIDLSYDQEGIEEFTVEFQILWWEAIRGNSPNAGGIDIN